MKDRKKGGSKISKPNLISVSRFSQPVPLVHHENSVFVGFTKGKRTEEEGGQKRNNNNNVKSSSQKRHHHDGTTSNQLKPLMRITKYLVQTYQNSNKEFQYASSLNPRRVITKPSQGVSNNKNDNVNADLIIYVNDILGLNRNEGKQRFEHHQN